MADVIQIATTIEKIVKEIGEYRRRLELRGDALATATRDYDRKMAITLATLRDGEVFELGGKAYKSPPVTILEKIAKGLCCDERHKLVLAETGYKACITNINALQAQLNANQSLFRYLDSTGNS